MSNLIGMSYERKNIKRVKRSIGITLAGFLESIEDMEIAFVDKVIREALVQCLHEMVYASAVLKKVDPSEKFIEVLEDAKRRINDLNQSLELMIKELIIKEKSIEFFKGVT